MKAISTQTFRIKIQGRVQGVGFRPFVYKLAQELALPGRVYNNEEGVIIELNTSSEILAKFCKELKEKAPPQAEILALDNELVPQKEFSDFQILASQKSQQLNLPLTPDFALCEQCREDIRDPQNRRYQYAFTSCVNCGPRYGLTLNFPFERDHTSLSTFPMCSDCLQEYKSPEDRRFHSQTNSCPQCGPEIQLTDKQGFVLSKTPISVFQKAASFIKEGKLLALKNTSGYLLCGDARSEKVVQQLRAKKRRPRKPLAVIYPSLDRLAQEFKLKAIEKQTLTSGWAPIVLLDVEKKASQLALKEIAPDLNQVGVMLPYSALLQLLLDQLDFPMIATSGNIHGSPILSKENEAREILAPIADYFLEHNLPISFPQDDSVIKFSPKYEQPLILRRSRGQAPNFLLPSPGSKKSILAMGAHLKNTIAFLPEKHIYLSPYFGNMDHYEVSLRSKETVDKYLDIFEKTPEVILVDQNPTYQSSILGEELAETLNIPTQKIQHHKAHFASVLGEHHLWESKEKILGVVWDGTGLGEDGAIWGGEFFVYQDHQIHRVNHFAYFDWIAADKMAREPRLSLLSLCSPKYREYGQKKFTPQEWKIYQNRLQKSNLKTSSVGRLFDSVASALGITDDNSYEGEAAMMLESRAKGYLNQSLQDYLEGEAYQQIPGSLILEKVIQDRQSGVPPGLIAAHFHFTLAQCIHREAKKMEANLIALSGGVFQNATLVDMLISTSKNVNNLKFNCKLSSNDENIALGQLMYHQKIQ